MEKQSQVVKDLHAALDELELLVIEGENIDLDIVEGLMAKFEKLKKIVEERKQK